jgi:uncharacterized protein (DUF1810 family)
VDEAKAYLRDLDLRSRLLSIAGAVADQLESGKLSIGELMASEIDALKVVSSLTLFRHIARELHESEGLDAYLSVATVAERVLTIAAGDGYPPCAHTLRFLGQRG